MKMKLTLITLTAILAISTSSCTDQNTASLAVTNSNPTSSASTSVAETDKTKTLIGKTYTAGTLEYTITHTRALTEGRMKPAASGNYFFIVGVEIKNTASSTFDTIYSLPIAVAQFGLRNAKDKSIDVIAGTGDTDGKFEALKRIEAGEKVYGELMYEVPKSADKLHLTISDEKGENAEKIELSAANIF